ncbi:MAG: peptidylprolyl isomerase [Candidatus Aenigmarchaeota archaeon]|nr:peptidylprolyl isomerase [Candidatus Aenigmarchaeota archaeon]
MTTVKAGDKIAVDYWGTLDNGTQFDTSEGRQPLEFEAGAGQMIAGFDKAVIGMKVGEEKSVKIAPADAYGEYDKNAVMVVPIEQMQQSGIEPEEGQTLYIGGQPVKILKVTDTEVTIDANHPLAGKTLNFKIKIVSINGKN